MLGRRRLKTTCGSYPADEWVGYFQIVGWGDETDKARSID
jgi:hypothetical protein